MNNCIMYKCWCCNEDWTPTGCAAIQAVDTKSGILLGQLMRFDLRDGIHRRKPGVLRERHGNALQGFGEGTEGVLLQSTDLVGLSGASQRAGDLSRASAVQDLIILHDVADGAQGVVYRPFRLLDDLQTWK